MDLILSVDVGNPDVVSVDVGNPKAVSIITSVLVPVVVDLV